MIERIAVIGGSSVYTPELVLALISHNINVREISLIGRAGRKLSLVARFCQRLLDKSGFPAAIHATADVKEGVAGARYVINHVRVGGMQARLRDERIPPKYGMIGSDVLGAGGIVNALRTLPVVFDIAEQVEQASPDCNFINLTNPMSTIVEGLLRYTNLNVLGVSDVPRNYRPPLAELLGADPQAVWMDYIGLNHMGWIQDVKVNGQSHMSRLVELLDQTRQDGFDHGLIELFRMIPTKNVAMFFRRDDILKQQKSCARFRAEILHEAELQILKLYEDEDLSEIPALTRARNAVWYEKAIVPLIQALESQTESATILCVRNGESVRDLPEEASIEIPVRLSSEGVAVHKAGSLPRFLRGLFTTLKESDRLTVEAVRHKSYEQALQALTIHPLVSSFDTAAKFLNRTIKEEKLALHGS